MYQETDLINKIAKLFGVFSLVIIILAILAWGFGSIDDLISSDGFSDASRMINGIFTGLLTSMAVLITLSGNLYSPRLIRLFVVHPIVIFGISYILFCNLLIILNQFFPSGHPFTTTMAGLAYFFIFLAIAGLVPYLYYIINFVRPQFFVPLLQKQAENGLILLHNSPPSKKLTRDTFGVVEVIVNIAWSAHTRGDRQLMLLTLKSLHKIYMKILVLNGSEKYDWRKEYPLFNSGISITGRVHLLKSEMWPEALIMAKYVKILGNIHTSQNEIVAEVLEDLLETTYINVQKKRDDIIHLQLMVFNSIARDSLKDRDIDRLMLVSYYYRVFIEMVIDLPEFWTVAIKSLRHYCKRAVEMEMKPAKEALFYDVGEILFHIGEKRGQKTALDIYQNHFKEIWAEDFFTESHMGKVARRAVVKAYWTFEYKGWNDLSLRLKRDFLLDDNLHFETLDYLLKIKVKLHWEFNDRLLRFPYMPKKAKELSKKFHERIKNGTN